MARVARYRFSGQELFEEHNRHQESPTEWCRISVANRIRWDLLADYVNSKHTTDPDEEASTGDNLFLRQLEEAGIHLPVESWIP